MYPEEFTFIQMKQVIRWELYKEVHNTIWEPWPQIITNRVFTIGTNSIRGELQETNLSGLKSK